MMKVHPLRRRILFQGAQSRRPEAYVCEHRFIMRCEQRCLPRLPVKYLQKPLLPPTKDRQTVMSAERNDRGYVHMYCLARPDCMFRISGDFVR